MNSQRWQLLATLYILVFFPQTFCVCVFVVNISFLHSHSFASLSAYHPAYPLPTSTRPLSLPSVYILFLFICLVRSLFCVSSFFRWSNLYPFALPSLLFSKKFIHSYIANTIIVSATFFSYSYSIFIYSFGGQSNNSRFLSHFYASSYALLLFYPLPFASM